MLRRFFNLKESFTIFFVMCIFLAQPAVVRGQMLYGDPSYLNDEKAPIKIGLGAGTTIREELKLKSAPITVQTSGGQSLTVDVNPVARTIKSSQVFLSGSAKIGKAADVFGMIGQTKISDPLNGDATFSGGAGIRISPPHQSGLFRLGLLLGASMYSGKGTSLSQTLGSDSIVADGDRVFFGAYGTGEEKMTIRRYDALLGFGVDRIPYVRPYAGILMSRIEGTDEVSFSGYGNVCVIPAGGNSCTSQTLAQTQFSVKRDIQAENMIGGVIGMVLNPGGDIDMVLEGQVGTSYSISLSAFMSF